MAHLSFLITEKFVTLQCHMFGTLFIGIACLYFLQSMIFQGFLCKWGFKANLYVILVNGFVHCIWDYLSHLFFTNVIGGKMNAIWHQSCVELLGFHNLLKHFVWAKVVLLCAREMIHIFESSPWNHQVIGSWPFLKKNTQHSHLDLKMFNCLKKKVINFFIKCH